LIGPLLVFVTWTSGVLTVSEAVALSLPVALDGSLVAETVAVLLYVPPSSLLVVPVTVIVTDAPGARVPMLSVRVPVPVAVPLLLKVPALAVQVTPVSIGTGSVRTMP